MKGSTIIHSLTDRIIRITVALIMAAGAWTEASADSGTLFCREIGLPEGLSSDKVTALVQDDMGRLWIGTHKGVNCFDSQKTNTPNIYRNSRITALFSLPGRIIICSVGGMVDYSIKTGQWHPITKDGVQFPGVVSGFTEGDELVFVCNDTVYSYTYAEPKPEVYGPSGIVHMAKDKYGDVWGSTQGKVYRVTEGTARAVEYSIPDLDINQTVSGIFAAGSGIVWAWSTAGDIYRYSRTADSFVKEELKDADGKKIVTDNISCIRENINGQLVIGYHDGVVVFDTNDRVATPLKYNNPSFDRLHTVTAVECSPNGDIFAGSFFNGVFIMSPAAYDVRLCGLNSSYSERNSTSTVANNIYEFEDGSLLVGTNNNSLAKLDKDGNYLNHYGADLPADVLTIVADASGNIWTGLQYSGIYRIDKDGAAHEVIPQKGRFSGACISDILPAAKDIIYVANEHGIDMLHPSSMEVHPAIVSKNDCLYFGVVQIGDKAYFINYNSIFVVDKSGSGQKEIPFNSPVESSFRCGCAGPLGSLLLGTDNGEIFLFDPVSTSFHLMNNSTFKNSEVSNIIIDRSGKVWATSGNRMCVFSPDGKCLNEYGLAGILERRLFNIRSSILCHNGDIIFGTTDGIIRFSPEKLEEASQYTRHIYVSELWVQNIPLSQMLDNGKATISKDGEIVLNHNSNLITVVASIIDYSPFNTGAHNVEVQVRQLHLGWEPAPDDLTIKSQPLKAGIYENDWRILSANGDVLSQDTITVRIKPHWLASTPMLIFYAILLLALCYLGYRLEKKATRRKEEAFRKEESRRINEQFNTRRMELLIGMGNEFKAPISIVSSVLSSGDLTSSDLVKNNVTKMRFLVDQMLELEKFALMSGERGGAKLYDFAAFVKLVCDRLVPQLEKNRIHLSIEGCGDTMPAVFDAGKMELILCNILKHLSKVAQMDSNATLSLKKKDDKISLRLRSKVKPGIDTAGEIGLHIANCLCDLSGYTLVEAPGKSMDELNNTLTIPATSPESDGMTSLEGYNFGITERIADSVADEGFSPTEFRDSEGHRKYSLLVIDGDDGHIELIKRSLKQDMHVRSAKNGEEALQKMASGEFDIILSEIDLPDMSGYDLCRAVKSKDAGHTAPVILMNYGMTEQKRLMALAANADQTIEKPVSLPSLFLMIRNLLQSDEEMRNKLMEVRGLDLSSQKMNRSDDRMVEKAIAYIKANLNSSIAIGSLAEALGVSRSRLYDDFNRVTKMPPGDFILKIKMQEACSMLESTNLTASEISYKLGYCNPNHFTRQFKSVYGKTPIAWRKEKTARS